MKIGKIITFMSISLVFLLGGGVNNSMAADISDVQGTYEVLAKDALKIKGIKDGGTDLITIALNSDGTVEIEAGEETFTGSFSIIKNGKKIQVRFSALEKEDLKASWTEWIEDIAKDKGADFQATKMVFKKFKIIDIPINNKNNMPKKLNITVKGTIQGNLDGDFVTLPFTYKLRLTFLRKL